MGLVIVSNSVLSHPYSLSCLSFRKSPPISTRFHRRRWLKSPSCRLNGFATTCFITSGEVEVNQFATESELSKDLPSVPSGCSTIPIVRLDSEILKTEPLKLLSEDGYIDNLLTPLPILSKEEQDALAAIPSGCSTSPIVHLDSDLQSEPLKLLNEDNYIDNLLTTLPVLSEEEQDALAAIPAHPAGLYALYATSLAGNLVEQLWNFAWPAAVALLHPSLLPVAVVGCFTKLAIFVGGPLIGNLMDTYPRALAYNSLCLLQTAAQLISVAMVIHALNTITPASSVLLQPWFVVLVLAGAIERLTGLATGVALERDWVVLLAGRNRPIALARANAMLSRIDLLCEIAGASLFGILLSKYDPVTCLKLAAGLMIYTMPVLVLLVWLTNKLSSGVLERPKFSHTCDRTYRSSLQDGGNLVERSFNAIKNGWLEYKQQPVLPASLAYVFLCFNVVLAPGSLMISFLTQRGLNPSIIGGFSGLCAFMGVAATFISATLVKRFGILKAGAAGLIFQASLLTIAVAVYWSGSLSQQTPLLFFLCLIALSRLGHMSYDVVGQQILQTGIPTSKANLIGATEVSMASLAEFVMLGVAIVANDASHFGLLAMLSVSSVVGAAWMFCHWLGNPTDEHRQLFSFDPHF